MSIFKLYFINKVDLLQMTQQEYMHMSSKASLDEGYLLFLFIFIFEFFMKFNEIHSVIVHCISITFRLKKK